MKYIYVKTSHYIQGLPARDLDDKELSDEQKAMLAEAVAKGIYKAGSPVRDAPKKKSTGETNVSEPESGHTE